MNELRRRGDAGLTLIELIVVVVLLGILGSAVALILVNSWRAQNDVTTTTQATNTGQLLGQQIERAVRNADAIKLTSDGRYLATRVTHGASPSTCQAFWIRSDGSLDTFVTSSSAPLPTVTSGSWPTPWIKQLVVRNPPYFQPTSASGVTYRFSIKTDAAPVVISGEVSPRNTAVISTDAAPEGASPCWS